MSVHVNSGEIAYFTINGLNPGAVRVRFENALRHVGVSFHDELNSQKVSEVSVADELTKLADLKDRGILTQEEFDKKKAQLLS